MPYVTQAQLIERFGERELIQLTDRLNMPPIAIGEAIVAAAIADAEGLVTPPILSRMAADVARYYLHGKAAEKDGPVHRAYLEAVRWLESVSKGIVQIDAAGVTPAPAGGGAVRVSTADRVFTRDSLKGM
jgi:phage gp36-like protein